MPKIPEAPMDRAPNQLDAPHDARTFPPKREHFYFSAGFGRGNLGLHPFA